MILMCSAGGNKEQRSQLCVMTGPLQAAHTVSLADQDKVEHSGGVTRAG